MAHFAQLNNDNIVQQVIAVNDADAPTETAGQAFIANTLKLDGVWLQTSYNTYRDMEAVVDDDDPMVILEWIDKGSKHRLGGTPFRGQYAGIGDVYDADTDEFVPPAPVEAGE